MKVYDHVESKEWQEIVDKCNYATFFHTPIWSRIFAETYPEMAIATKKYVFADGTKVILPLIRIKVMKGLLSAYVSNAADVYGGIVSEKSIEQEKIYKIFESLIKRNIARVVITGNFLANYSLPKRYKSKRDFTQIIKLEKREKEILANFKSSTRNKINKAKRAGVTFREAQNISEWKVYYSIYQEALRRWGDKATNRYPFSLFENMFKTKNQNIKLWLVIYDGKIVGGNVNYYHKEHCVEWHASFLSDYFRYGIRNFLVYRIILNANEKGYKYYDFNPSGGHQGTEKFKKSCGAETQPINRWEWKNFFVDRIWHLKQRLPKI